MAPYAAKTEVTVDRSRAAIEKLIVEKHKGTHYLSYIEPGAAQVAFSMRDRNIRFKIPLPAKLTDQERRQRWRALLLVITAKFESVESGIETLEEAFFAHVVMPGGSTVYEVASEAVKLNYVGQYVPLLPAPPTS